MGSLGKFISIKESKDFSLIYKNARKWHCEVAVVYFLNDENYRLSAVASKKIGKAIKRNRARRVLKAAFLNLNDNLKKGSYVLIAKNSINDKKTQEVEAFLRLSFKKLNCLI